MSKTRTGIGRRILFVTCTAALALSAVARTASAQEDLSPVKTAITQLKQLPASAQRVVDVIRAQNFGPSRIEGSCDYGAEWYTLGINTHTLRWAWNFPGFDWMKAALEQYYNDVASVSAQFDAHFAPVKNWLSTAMPQFVTHLDAAAKDMQASEQMISSRSSSAEQRAEAASAIQARFAELGTRLDEGSDQLRVGVANLSRFNNQLNTALGQINSARQQMEARFAADTDEMNQRLTEFRCDAGYIRGKNDEYKAQVRAQFDRVVAAAEEYGVVSAETDRAVSLILGTVENLRSRYRGIKQNLQAAKITPAGAVQELRLQVAINTWQDLANFARQQLQ